MSVSTEELIAINSLLIEREAEYTRVHSIEAQINQLLGAEYPFPHPGIELPSSRKRKKVKTKASPKTTGRPLKIRRLTAQEVAYRITWFDRGTEKTSDLKDAKSIAPILQAPLPGTRLVRIETINLQNEVIERLF